MIGDIRSTMLNFTSLSHLTVHSGEAAPVKISRLSHLSFFFFFVKTKMVHSELPPLFRIGYLDF